jgi:hypothetical protein
MMMTYEFTELTMPWTIEEKEKSINQLVTFSGITKNTG